MHTVLYGPDCKLIAADHFHELHKGQHVLVHPMDDRPGFAQSVDILVDPR